MVRVNIAGRMEEYTKEIGSIIRCMAEESLFGLMVVDTKVSTIMIKSMDMGFLHSKMEGYTKEDGKMENNMAKESIERKKQ